MLRSHLSNVEDVLLSKYRMAGIAGHSVDKGTPRETFVKEFLGNHMPSLFEIGSGEVIDCDSRPGESRNQHDVIIFQRTYPKIHLDDKVSCFLVESVSATIEVKSVLDKDAVRQAVRAANRVKCLRRSRSGGISIGCNSPDIFSGLVAYDGPANMARVGIWIRECEEELGYSDCNSVDAFCGAYHVASPTLDSVVLLGKGVAYSRKQSCVVDSCGAGAANFNWRTVESSKDNLFLFFMQLMPMLTSIKLSGWDMSKYLGGAAYSNLQQM